MKSRGGQVTNSSAVYEEPCAEHVFAMMLALARQLPQQLDEQRGVAKILELRRPSPAQLRSSPARSVVILSYGSIATAAYRAARPLPDERSSQCGGK